MKRINNKRTKTITDRVFSLLFVFSSLFRTTQIQVYDRVLRKIIKFDRTYPNLLPQRDIIFLISANGKVSTPSLSLSPLSFVYLLLIDYVVVCRTRIKQGIIGRWPQHSTTTCTNSISSARPIPVNSDICYLQNLLFIQISLRFFFLIH